MSLQSLDILKRSATTTPPPQQRQMTEVAKLIDVTKCIGCKACQSACQEWNDLREEVGINEGSYQNPHDLTENSWTLMRFAEHEQNGTLEWLIRKDGCMHCADPGCLKAGCPFDVPRISKKDSKAYKCTLCSDRVSVGLEPACIKACPTQALVFGSKEDMIDHANDRIADLRERGFDQAGLYDPAGVGGTHVMYVLHHADQPQLYNDLPKEPTISPTVGLWKGMMKPLATAAMLFTALAGFFHYVTIGPNDAEDDEEDHKA